MPFPDYSPLELDFFRSIAAEPLSNTPRLVYADWLQDCGDPLGALIRSECHQSSNYRRTQFNWEQNSLVIEHELAELWSERLSKFPIEFNGLDRGLVDWISISSEDFAACAEELFRMCPWLSCIYFNDSLDTLPDSPYWARVRCLRISAPLEEGRVSDVLTSDCFERLHSLSVSSIDDVTLDQNDVVAMFSSAAVRELRELDVLFSNLNPRLLSVLEDVAPLEKLETLKLPYNENLTAEAVAFVLNWDGISNATTLDFGGCPLGHEGIEALVACQFLSSLKTLSLDDCGIQGASSTLLLGTTNLPSIEELSLFNNSISGEGLRPLADGKSKVRYRSFSFGYNRIDEMGARFIANSRQLSDCEYLNIGADLSPASIRAIADSEHLNNVRHLSLSGNTLLADAGIVELAAGSGLERVESGSLDGCGIGPVGTKALLNAPFTAKLVHLDLQENPIGDLGVEAITNCESIGRLASLEVSDCELTDKGACALARTDKLPGLMELFLDPGEFGEAVFGEFLRTTSFPILRLLWLPDLDDDTSRMKYRKLLHEHFGPAIDLGEID